MGLILEMASAATRACVLAELQAGLLGVLGGGWEVRGRSCELQALESPLHGGRWHGSATWCYSGLLCPTLFFI